MGEEEFETAKRKFEERQGIEELMRRQLREFEASRDLCLVCNPETDTPGTVYKASKICADCRKAILAFKAICTGEKN